ncbi:ATP-binding cassette sub-family B member 6, mitochondrial-like [Mizuhopecten yessoensis]|uniref:ATP-binding cassette sub-family B member 6 n=1 Tax=Mizuhopecten yessoensis TaxID=6573 RepID=A0A210PRI9_MIZYE|nr:ATP-binding cassette sub-family B member 6, mitochondrial-like [Mizuhopecten yessoensis]OWF39062.1 ATP-binding cassette sub-family B member 6, mitochondrial [Mizuhopecten yessoensis]
MQFCHNTTDFTIVWSDKGINSCFLDTIASSVIFVFLLIFGCIQCSIFRKYSIPVDKKIFTEGSCGFSLQIILTLILALEAVVHVILQDIMIQPEYVVGYQLLTALAMSVVWMSTIRLLLLERNSALPSIPTRGHGLVLLVIWGLAFIKENLAFVSWWSPLWWWSLETKSDKIEFGLWVVRYACVLLVLGIGLRAPGVPSSRYHMLINDAEQRGGGRSRVHEGSTWANVLKKLRMMLPYVWPKGSRWRQLVVIACLVILGVGRGINVLVPIYSKYIVNSLSEGPVSTTVQADVHRPEFCWEYILIYSVLLFLKGGGSGTSGFLSNIRTFLWIPVQQFTTRKIQVKLFRHLHSLSLRWHLQRKTGEVLRVVDRGTNSINSLLSYVVFQILPTIIDIVIAIVYFITTFNYLFGLVVFVCMVLYLTVTIGVTEWRTKYRRDMNKLDNERNSKSVDSLLNFETVKYYGASEFETNRYDEAIVNYQKAEWKSTASLNMLNTGQNVVITAGVLTGSLLCAWAVVHSLKDLKLTVGDYVLFGTYINQLYAPLNWLGTYYRMIQQSFIDMENMFELLEEDKEVGDIPGAKPLESRNGEIQLKNVNFSYEPSKQILKNVSFHIPSGETYAIVGHSGSGKSTILRLLFRFYDIQSGKILIDGKDIALVQQESLRQCIGVVPQDTVLFNSDIRYNIRYGKFAATDQEVEDAADNADIHSRILSFPNKYETVVGERGLKLSGGEKQRVAIARTLLKSPAVVLLDEATSALDTKTERNIQASLARVCENRTTIIVAHRLSTIIHAHQILVMKEGEIIERGTHEELIAKGDHYAGMWQEQLTKREEVSIQGDNDGNTSQITEDSTNS